MARIRIEADTSKLIFDVFVNDVKIENVRYVNLEHMPKSSYNDAKLYFNAITYETDKDDDVKKHTQIMAEEKNVKIQTDSEKKSKIYADILDYFKVAGNE